MIGSRRKIRLIFDGLLAQGISEDVLDRVYAPVGFDIGSQTVPEIAVSIVAELIQRNGSGEVPDLGDGGPVGLDVIAALVPRPPASACGWAVRS